MNLLPLLLAEGWLGADFDRLVTATERLGVATVIVGALLYCGYRILRWIGNQVQWVMERFLGEEKGVATLWVSKQIETMDKLLEKAAEQSQTNSMICDQLTVLSGNEVGHNDKKMKKLEDIHDDVKHVKGKVDNWHTVKQAMGS